MNSALALANQTDRLLVGVPAGREEEGRHWSADIAEGLRRLQAQVAAKDPDKVSFRCIPSPDGVMGGRPRTRAFVRFTRHLCCVRNATLVVPSCSKICVILISVTKKAATDSLPRRDVVTCWHSHVLVVALN